MPRNRPDALALETKQKALAGVARPKSTPYPKWEGIQRERQHPFLLVNKMGGKPRLAKLAKEQDAYERRGEATADQRYSQARRRRSHSGGQRFRLRPQVATPVDPTVPLVARKDCLEGRWDMSGRAAEQRTRLLAVEVPQERRGPVSSEEKAPPRISPRPESDRQCRQPR